MKRERVSVPLGLFVLSYLLLKIVDRGKKSLLLVSVVVLVFLAVLLLAHGSSIVRVNKREQA